MSRLDGPGRRGPSVLQLLGPSQGGIRRHVATLSSHLQDRGWTVATAGPDGVMEAGDVAHHPVPVGTRPSEVLLGRRALRRLVAGSGFDLVHAHGLKAGWLATVSRLRVPIVLTVHNVVLDESRQLGAPVLRVLERALPARVDRVIAVSGEIAGRLPGGAAVIPPVGPVPRPARDAGEVRRDHGVGPTAPLVVTVARLHPQKDVPNLLRAAVEVHAALPAARFVVVGDGPERARLLDMAAALGLDEVVTFAGHRPNPADELAAADVVVLSSSWEGSPLVVAEALLLGRPIVATAVGAVPEVVVDGGTGRLVPPGDSGALARAVVDLLADRALADRLAAAGRELAEERFGQAGLVEPVVGVYRDLLPG